MKNESKRHESDLVRNLKWLMLFRVLFTTLLLGSTIILQLSESDSPLAKPLVVLYGLIVGIFFLSFFYAALINRIRRHLLFAYIQTGADTLIVTLIIYVTGSYTSVFSFLYLLVITYSSILLFRPGSMIMAALCSIQYGIMIDLEFYGVLSPFIQEVSFSAGYYPWSYVLYKILMIMMACFAVAFLSSLLSERERRTKRELVALEDKVKRVEKMAAMGEMAAGMAHEIKNPLASLAGAIQLLKEDLQYNPDQEKLMEIVLRETKRLSSLLSDFLLFAKPPAGKVETIRLDNALSEIIALFKKDISKQDKITISEDLYPDVWIEMDPGHLHQVFWNLLLNAAEAIKAEGNIRIEMYPIKKENVGVKIIDDGFGMTREMIKSIFDPFFTTKSKGTGLGLSVAHSILESYGIEMNVESTVDAGTAFILELKRVNPLNSYLMLTPFY